MARVFARRRSARPTKREELRMNALIMATAMAVAPAPAAPAQTAPVTPEAAPAPAEAAPAPAEAAPAPPEAAPTHSVLPGESLSLIAQCELGDANRWTDVLDLNAGLISNPDIIVAGWILALPQGASGDCPTEPVVQAASPAPATPVKAAQAAPKKRQAAPAHTHAAPAQRSSGGSSGSGLAGIRACESGGNYGAVSSSGKYRGAYQFDSQTWASVGGSGDPAAASPAEQDQRAAALQAKRGSSPWPTCG